MLGLATSVQNNKGYATGEKNRERFNLPINNTAGAYHATSNPVGFNGSNYIGGFDNALEYANFTDVNATKSNPLVSGHASNVLRVTAGATNGNTSVYIKTVPNVAYTLSIDVVAVEAGSACVIMVGTGLSDTTYYSSGNVTGAATKTTTFTPAEISVCLTILSKTNTKYVDVYNISFKRA